MSIDGNIDPPSIDQQPASRKRRSTQELSTPDAQAMSAATPQPRVSGGGLGCGLAGLVILSVIALVCMGLFLPPFSFGERLFGTPYAPLNAQSPNLTKDKLTVAVDPSNPGSDFAVRIKSISIDAFLGRAAVEQDDSVWVRAARAASPPALTLSSPIYRIETQGTAPDMASLSVSVPAAAIGFDLYRFDTQTSRWQFVPAHASSDGTALVASVKTIPDRVALFKIERSVPIVNATVDVGQQITPAAAQTFNVIHPAGMQPTTSGTLQGVLPAGIDPGHGYAIIPVIRNFANPAAIDAATVTGLLQNSGLRSAHIERLVDFAARKAYQGLAIDYRKLAPDQRENFSAFITELAQRLHNANLTLTVTVPFPAQTGSSFNTGAYDWQTIGAASDTIQLLLPLDPQTFVERGLVNQVLAWAVGEVNRAKLQIALSVLSVQDTAGAFTTISYSEALAPLGQVTAKPPVALPDTPIEATLTGYKAQFMPLDSSGTPSIKYFAPDGTLASTVWLTTGAVIRSRLSRIAAYDVTGIAALDLATPGAPADALGAITAYKVNQLTDTQATALALRWIVSAQGTVVAEMTGVPGTPFVYKPGADKNRLQINAQVGNATLGPDVVVQVASLTPSPSPTLPPTVAPTSTPPPTSTPRPVASKAPASSGTKTTGNPAPAISGKISGSFETGGQVQDLNGGTIAHMKRAGMKWVKRQAHSGDGGAGGLISQAHGAGFKILLSVIGDKGQVTNPGYMDQYAAYVGGLAAQGADALEIWNEMNIDREWPTGQINPAKYVELLSRAYKAIKGANGNTLVISGALSPTGAEGAFGTDRVWNDDRYYAGLASAGAGQFLDCVGVHYNEGIVSPTQTGGDPRDNYPTRYFSTMLNRAVGPFGGKPACFTELGYLTPEGYGTLPSGFAWAQKVTVAQQAAWLAQAAVAASSTGRVRLMIVFNVDFTYWGADPQAGYAMIRPGGACPACDTMGQVSR